MHIEQEETCSTIWTFQENAFAMPISNGKHLLLLILKRFKVKHMLICILQMYIKFKYNSERLWMKVAYVNDIYTVMEFYIYYLIDFGLKYGDCMDGLYCLVLEISC